MFHTIKEHVTGPANRCPVKSCQSEDVSGGFVEIVQKQAIQSLSCSACGAQWTETYELSTYKVNALPEEAEINNSEILGALVPSQTYSFQTSPGGRTLPCLPAEFVKSAQYKESLISIDDGIGEQSTRIWAVYEGYGEKAYAHLVTSLFRFLTGKALKDDALVNLGYLSQQSIYHTVSECCKKMIGVDIALSAHIDGLIDVTVNDFGGIRRAVIARTIKKGDIFNVYHGQSSKNGGDWGGNLIDSLITFWQWLKKEQET